MRMSQRDFQALSAAIAPLDTAETRDLYRTRSPRIPRIELTKDIDVRYRWDLYWSVRGYTLIHGDYLTSHIDTALRRIVAPLTEGSRA